MISAELKDAVETALNEGGEVNDFVFEERSGRLNVRIYENIRWLLSRIHLIALNIIEAISKVAKAHRSNIDVILIGKEGCFTLAINKNYSIKKIKAQAKEYIKSIKKYNKEITNPLNVYRDRIKRYRTYIEPYINCFINGKLSTYNGILDAIRKIVNVFWYKKDHTYLFQHVNFNKSHFYNVLKYYQDNILGTIDKTKLDMSEYRVVNLVEVILITLKNALCVKSGYRKNSFNLYGNMSVAFNEVNRYINEIDQESGKEPLPMLIYR